MTDAVTDEVTERIAIWLGLRLVALLVVALSISLSLYPPETAADLPVIVVVNALALWFAVQYTVEAAGNLLEVTVGDAAPERAPTSAAESSSTAEQTSSPER